MAMSTKYMVSELLVISRGITFNGLYQGSHNVQVARTLYSAGTLGLDNYIKFRERVENQFTNISDKFRDKMNEFSVPNCTRLVFTEDLKNMLHLVQPGNKDDLDLTMKMIKQFNEQNKELRFGSFCFGPVIMRMLYFLNEPLVALEAFKSQELNGFFDQVTSCHVFMDLLFKNEMYQDVLDIFDIVTKKQFQDAKFPKHIVLLAFAACYKMNTPDSLKYTINLWKKLQEVGHVPLRRSTTYAAALALNQHSAHITLEMLSTLGQPNYVTVRNLKLSAFADIGRPEDGFPLLRNILEKDDPKGPQATVTKDVFEKIRTSVATSGNDISIREFAELEKSLNESGHISDSTLLDDLLCKEIVSIPHDRGLGKGHHRQVTEASFSRQRQQRSSFNRPGLRDLD